MKGDEKFGADIILIKAWIIDPTKVARTALQNAASVAAWAGWTTKSQF